MPQPAESSHNTPEGQHFGIPKVQEPALQNAGYQSFSHAPAVITQVDIHMLQASPPVPHAKLAVPNWQFVPSQHPVQHAPL